MSVYYDLYVTIAIEASIKTKVIQQWLAGDSRPKIAIDNNIGEGTAMNLQLRLTLLAQRIMLRKSSSGCGS